jgi:hypothetical protein
VIWIGRWQASTVSAGNPIAGGVIAVLTACLGLTGVATASPDSDRKGAVPSPPQTRIVKAHVKRKHGFARFRFTSSEPGSTFSCKLDDHRFRSCSSPITYRHLKEGRHHFKVRATSADGTADPTSARRRFFIGSRLGRPYPPVRVIEPARLNDGGACDYVPPSDFSPVRNGWEVANRGRITTVCAGGAGTYNLPSLGRFLILRTSYRWGTQDLTRVDVPHSGPVKITRAPLGRDVVTTAQRHGDLEFKGAKGVTGILHLKDDSITLNP